MQRQPYWGSGRYLGRYLRRCHVLGIRHHLGSHLHLPFHLGIYRRGRLSRLHLGRARGTHLHHRSGLYPQAVGTLVDIVGDPITISIVGGAVSVRAVFPE